MEVKKCAKCKTEKPVEDFAESARSADGYASVCIACKAEAAAEANIPTTNSVTPEEEARLIAEMTGDAGQEKGGGQEPDPILAPVEKAFADRPKRMLRGPDGFLYVWTPQLAARNDMTPVA